MGKLVKSRISLYRCDLYLCIAISTTTDTNSSALKASDMNSAVFIFYPSTPAMIAAAASAAKNTVQIAIRFFEILIFVRFYKCEKCGRKL